MKKITLILIQLLFVTNTFSQTSLDLEYTNMYNNPIIKASWNNLTKMLFCDMQTFRETMDEYYYDLATDGSCYIADTSVGSPYFTISKSNRSVNMIFSKDNGYVSAFRRDLKQRLGGGRVTYEKGFEVYYISYVHNRFEYSIKVMMQEYSNGSGCVVLAFQ